MCDCVVTECTCIPHLCGEESSECSLNVCVPRFGAWGTRASAGCVCTPLSRSFVFTSPLPQERHLLLWSILSFSSSSSAQPVMLALTALVFLSRYVVLFALLTSPMRHPVAPVWSRRSSGWFALFPLLCLAPATRRDQAAFSCVRLPLLLCFPTALKSVGSVSLLVCVSGFVCRERERCVPDLMMSQAGSGRRLEFPCCKPNECSECVHL